MANSDSLAAALRIHGVFYDAVHRREIAWQVHRTPLGLVLFVGIGDARGSVRARRGLGERAGSKSRDGRAAAVCRRAPAVSFCRSSIRPRCGFISTRARCLRIMAAPSVIGMMLGAFIGARLLTIIKASSIRKLVIVMLLAAGVRALAKGPACGRETDETYGGQRAYASQEQLRYARVLEAGMRLRARRARCGCHRVLDSWCRRMCRSRSDAGFVDLVGAGISACYRHAGRLGLAADARQRRYAAARWVLQFCRAFPVCASRCCCRFILRAATGFTLTIAVLEVAVLTLAASGVLTVGH